MKFMDGKENLEIEIIEGQQGFDATKEFFDGTSKPDENDNPCGDYGWCDNCY